MWIQRCCCNSRMIRLTNIRSSLLQIQLRHKLCHHHLIPLNIKSLMCTSVICYSNIFFFFFFFFFWVCVPKVLVKEHMELNIISLSKFLIFSFRKQIDFWGKTYQIFVNTVVSFLLLTFHNVHLDSTVLIQLAHDTDD